MGDGRPAWFVQALEALLGGQDLPADDVARLVEAVLAGEVGDVELASLLVALRSKGETGAELAAAAGVLRRHAVPLDAGVDGVLDTCGTGGDGLGTFNISTAAAFVVAGAGVPVVKHGNRAISGNTGSADVLAELGVGIVGGAEAARRCLREAGMAFCMAPLFHPALKRAADVRRRLGVRTMFNQLGPLCNPAAAPYQLLGVGRREWLPRMADAVARLGVRRALLVHADDGLDEVSLDAATAVYRVEAGACDVLRWTAEDFGMPSWPTSALRVEGPRESAAVIRRVLAGEAGAALDVVLANAGAALFTAGAARTLLEGVSLAREAVASGKAAAVLASLARLTA